MLFTVGPMLLGILPVLTSTINKVYNSIQGGSGEGGGGGGGCAGDTRGKLLENSGEK